MFLKLIFCVHWCRFFHIISQSLKSKLSSISCQQFNKVFFYDIYNATYSKQVRHSSAEICFKLFFNNINFFLPDPEWGKHHTRMSSFFFSQSISHISYICMQYCHNSGTKFQLENHNNKIYLLPKLNFEIFSTNCLSPISN